MSNSKRLAALIAVLVVLAACGTPPSGTGETDTVANPTTTVGDEVSTTTPSTSSTSTSVPGPGADASALFASLGEGSSVTSARIEGAIEMTGLDDSESGITEATIYFSTAFDSETGDSEFVMDMSSMMGDLAAETEDPFSGLAAGMLGNMEMRQIGDIVYLKYPFFSSMLGAETEWISMPAEDGEDFAGDFEMMPTDPAELIDSFDDSGASVEVVGTEEVNGVQATHYQVRLDTSEMEMTPEEEAELAEAGIWADGIIPLDIWVSEAGHMVRMIMEIDGTGMDAAPEEQFETMILRYDLFDINGDIVIEAPPADQVSSMEDLENAFGGLDG